jgi:hypothetical protein
LVKEQLAVVDKETAATPAAHLLDSRKVPKAIRRSLKLERDREMRDETSQTATLAQLSADTGLDTAFLEWALGARLLEGWHDDADGWRLPYDVAPPPRPDGAEAASDQEADEPVSNLPQNEVATHELTENRAAPAEIGSDVMALWRRIAVQEARLAEKDRIIADLGRSLARLGEAAAGGLAER